MLLRTFVTPKVCFQVPTVQKALCDDNSDVRQAAARTFDSFHNMVGSKALDDILPVMLEKLSDENTEEKENILDGLRMVMAIKVLLHVRKKM